MHIAHFSDTRNTLKNVFDRGPVFYRDPGAPVRPLSLHETPAVYRVKKTNPTKPLVPSPKKKRS